VKSGDWWMGANAFAQDVAISKIDKNLSSFMMGVFLEIQK